MSTLRWVASLPAAGLAFWVGSFLTPIILGVMLGVVSALTGPQPIEPFGGDVIRLASGVGGLASAWFAGTWVAGVRG